MTPRPTQEEAAEEIRTGVAVRCPRCGAKTYRVPIKLGWRIAAQGISSFPDYDFCVNGDWKAPASVGGS